MSATSDIWNVKDLLRIVGTQFLFFFFECIKNIFKIIFLLIIIRFRFGGLITLFCGLFLKVVCFWFRGVGNGMDYMALLRLSKIGFVIDSKFMYFTDTYFNITFLFMLFFFGIFNILYNIILLCDIYCNKVAIDCNCITVVCVSHSFTKRQRVSFSFTMNNLYFTIYCSYWYSSILWIMLSLSSFSIL